MFRYTTGRKLHHNALISSTFIRVTRMMKVMMTAYTDWVLAPRQAAP